MTLVDSLIKENMIRVSQTASDWKEAVKLGIECLVDAKKVTWDYYDAIIRSAHENGPYFILMPGVALPHARPENGVLASGFSFVTLKEAIDFGSPENDPISILLSFCSPNASSQVEESLAQAVTLFEDDNIVEKLMGAKTIPQMEKLLRTVKGIS